MPRTAEQVKQYYREWRLKNKIRLAEKKREYDRENRGAVNATKRRYYEAHKEQHGEYLRKARLRVIEFYSKGTNNCNNCGFDNLDALCIDHVNNDGAQHRRKELGASRGSGRKFYWWLIRNNYPTGFQVLCANCNLIKEIQKRRTIRREERANA